MVESGVNRNLEIGSEGKALFFSCLNRTGMRKWAQVLRVSQEGPGFSCWESLLKTTGIPS